MRSTKQAIERKILIAQFPPDGFKSSNDHPRFPQLTMDGQRTVEEIQRERRQRIRNYCGSARAKAEVVYSLEGKQLAHFLIDTRYQIFMCLNYKAGSRHLKRFMGALSGAVLPTKGLIPREAFKWGNNFSRDEKLFMSKTYFRVSFIREPLVRFLSAFIDKFYRVESPMYRLGYGRTIISTYRQNPSQESLDKGHDVKFSEFVQWVLDSPRFKLDEHWQLATVRCFFCAIEYDFIGKFENFQDELPRLYKEAGVPSVSWEFPFVSHNTSAQVNHYYSQLSREQIVQLAELYRPDYEAFGYPFPGPLFRNLVK